MSNLSELDQIQLRLTILHYQTLLDHNLPIIGIKFNRSKIRLGEYHDMSHIVISLEYCKVAPYVEMVDTVLHELSHHMDYCNRGELSPSQWHDDEWKKCCKIIGAKPKPTADLAEKHSPPAKYTATCPNHGVIEHFNRMGRVWRDIGYHCAKCEERLKVKKNY
jgi:predicted SprT family Zn-dependent metalloprotease